MASDISAARRSPRMSCLGLARANTATPAPPYVNTAAMFSAPSCVTSLRRRGAHSPANRRRTAPGRRSCRRRARRRETHNSVAAACLAIGLQQRAQPPHQRVRARQRIRCRPGRTTEAHEPQPAHTLASITTELPFGVIAPVGHRSRQRVHPVMPEREWAQSDSSK